MLDIGEPIKWRSGREGLETGTYWLVEHGKRIYAVLQNAVMRRPKRCRKIVQPMVPPADCFGFFLASSNIGQRDRGQHAGTFRKRIAYESRVFVPWLVANGPKKRIRASHDADELTSGESVVHRRFDTKSGLAPNPWFTSDDEREDLWIGSQEQRDRILILNVHTCRNAVWHYGIARAIVLLRFMSNKFGATRGRVGLEEGDMKLHLAGENPIVFYLESSYAEREAAKQAGFWWHGGSCRPGCAGCAAMLGKVWWTPNAETARKLVDVADSYARDVLLPDAPPPEKKSKKAAAYSKITDVNLQLALLEEFIARKLVARPSTAQGRESRYHERIRDKLLAVPLHPEALGAIDTLTWDVRAESIYQIFPQWDGEDDEFEIRSLAGIQLCPMLRKIEIQMFGGTDLGPLRTLEKLESIMLERPYSSEMIKDLSPLLELPSLREVRLPAARRSESNEEVAKALKAKGVRVSISLSIERVER